MGNVVEQLRPVAAHVGVPRVGVHDVAAPRLIGHRQVGRQRSQRGVGVDEHRVVFRMGDGARAGVTHAVHVDVGELHQLTDEEVDVDAGATVDVGRILAGQDPDAHPGRVLAEHAQGVGQTSTDRRSRMGGRRGP